MNKEIQLPIYQYKTGRNQKYIRYAYVCNGCNTTVGGYISSKVYGNVLCKACKKKKSDERAAKKQAEHDIKIKNDIIDKFAYNILLECKDNIDNCDNCIFGKSGNCKITIISEQMKNEDE